MEKVFVSKKSKLLAIGASISVTLFIAVMFYALSANPRRGELAFLEFMQSLSNPALDQLVVIITTFGEPTYLMIAAVLVASYFIYKKWFKQASILLLGVVGSGMINVVIKHFAERSRPEVFMHLINETGYSFPSGHATLSAALVLTVLVLLWRTKWRNWVIVIGAIYVLLIAASRLYLAVHYPSDIIGGWLMAGACVLSTMLLLELSKQNRT